MLEKNLQFFFLAVGWLAIFGIVCSLLVLFDIPSIAVGLILLLCLGAYAFLFRKLLSTHPATFGYSEQASELLKRYEALDSETVHADWLEWFPTSPSCILDIGAGSGRDAAWLVSLGHSVIAVEPTDELRVGAVALHTEPKIEWRDDELPELKHTQRRNQKFDMVLLSAVWMHLNRTERRIGMKTMASLMAPGARLFISIRHGPSPKGRHMFNTKSPEVEALAAWNGLTCILNFRTGSVQADNAAAGIEWTKLVFEKPA